MRLGWRLSERSRLRGEVEGSMGVDGVGGDQASVHVPSTPIPFVRQIAMYDTCMHRLWTVCGDLS